MKDKNYFRFRHKNTGEIRQGWCKSRNPFEYCTRRKMIPSFWICEESIIDNIITYHDNIGWHISNN